MSNKKEGYHRAKAMLPAIKNLITEYSLSNNLKREDLADVILTKINNDYPDETSPTRETIIKLISTARNKPVIDEPWHLGILSKLNEKKLNDYGIRDISAEAIEAILKVERWLQDSAGEATHNVITKKKEITELGLGAYTFFFHTLSVRQAKWISILYRTTGTNKPEYLWFVSFYYTYHEIISHISDTTFDTRDIDARLCRGKSHFLKWLEFCLKQESSIYGDNLEKAFNVLHNVLNNAPED